MVGFLLREEGCMHVIFEEGQMSFIVDCMVAIWDGGVGDLMMAHQSDRSTLEALGLGVDSNE